MFNISLHLFPGVPLIKRSTQEERNTEGKNNIYLMLWPQVNWRSANFSARHLVCGNLLKFMNFAN